MFFAFSLLKPYNTHNLQPHSTSYIFLGYLAYTKGYICQDSITSQIYISRHVLFNETEFLSYPSLYTSLRSHTSGSSQSSTSSMSPFLHQSPLPVHPSLPQNIPDFPSSTSPSISKSNLFQLSRVSPLSPQPTPALMPTSPSNTNLTDQSCIAGTAHIVTSESDQSTPAVLPAKPGKANSTVKPCKQGKVGSAPKPDYALTEPPSYKIAAQYPQWCSAMDGKFVALKRHGTWCSTYSPLIEVVLFLSVLTSAYNKSGFHNDLPI